MRKNRFAIVLVYCFFLLSDRAHGLGERTIVLGSAASWQDMEVRHGVAEAPRIRPHPVLVLSGYSGYAGDDAFLDLQLSFNEGEAGRFADSQGRYDVFASAELRAAPAAWSRTGAGAALFTGTARPVAGEGPLTIRPRAVPHWRPGALFAPGSHVQDFSIEFWLYPQNIENGAQIVSWASYKPDGRGDFLPQLVQCVVARNRTQWTFTNFFSSPGGHDRLSLTLSGPPLVPRTWSHHLIRFDAGIGLLEYWVDGELEAAEFTTSLRREGGDVFTPVIGENGVWTLGAHFSGMMDVFRIHQRRAEPPALARYHPRGGRVESRTLDMGRTNSRLVRLEASGGRTASITGSARNEYAGTGALRFADHSAVNFFVRTSNARYGWDTPWIPVTPGTELADIRGKYVQVAADFFPSADGQASPYLSEVRIVYLVAEPPPPPARLVAVAGDGAVELSWMPSPSREIGGYFVYFGAAPGEYFGDHAILDSMVHSSPINVGNRTSVRIEGLTNGRLYFFAVAAYNRPEAAGEGMPQALPEPGEFSREVAARPLPRPAGDR